MQIKVLPLFVMLLLSIFLSACDSDDPSPAVLTEIQLTSDVTELPVFFTTQLSAVGYLSDGRTEDLTYKGVWTSLSPAVASVNQGFVRGESPGNVEFTFVYEGLSSSIFLTVTNAAILSMVVDPVTSVVPLGVDVQYRAIGTFSDQSTHDVSLHADLTWISDQTIVATMDQLTAKANTLSAGSTRISATMAGTAGAVISNVTDLTVNNEIMTSIWITLEAATMPLGITQQFTATATYSNGTELDITDDNLNWSSTNFNVLESLGAGLFHAVREDSAQVSVTDPVEQMDSANKPLVRVVHKALDHIIVRAGEKGADRDSIPLGESVQFSVSAVFSDGSEYDISDFGQIHWQSSDTAMATVTLSGKVQAIGLGNVKITATTEHFLINSSKTVSIVP